MTIPPNATHAERELLGAMIRFPDCIADVEAILAAEFLYNQAHQNIFRAVCDIHATGTHNVTAAAVAQLLMDRHQLEDCGRGSYILELFEAAYSTGHVENHARLIQEKFAMRSLIHLGREIEGDAFHPGTQSTEIIAKIDHRIADIASGNGQQESEHISQVGHRTLINLNEKLDGRVPPSIKTGFSDLDHMIGGFKAGQSIIIAARTGVGKSQFAVSLMRNISHLGGLPGYIATLEMEPEEHLMRFICSECRFNAKRLEQSDLRIKPEELQSITDAADAYMRSPIWFNRTPGMRASQFCANVKRLVKQQNIKYVVLDYLGLLDSDNTRIPRQEQVAEQSKRIKRLAVECKIPIIVLHQLNRLAAEDRPQLHHLRESGALEQDADKVLLLYQPSTVEDPSGTELEVIVAKQRNGPTGCIKLHFDKPTGRIENAARF